MNVALCTDENYSRYALVTIISLFENNRSCEICVTVITDGLSKKSLDKFKRLAACYGQKINVVKIDVAAVRNLKTIENVFPVSMYYRYFLPTILSDQDRVLYLDCDIMVREDISDFYNSDLDGYAGMVVVDQSCDCISIHNRLNIKADYFNSGVILMNLDYWRHNDIFNKLVKFANDNSSILRFPDQDALNVILEGKVKYADYRYNMQEMWLTGRDEIEFCNWRLPDLNKSMKNPAIVHFCSRRKPWYKECCNPFLDEYLAFADMHKFAKIKRKHQAILIDRLYYSIRRRIK